RVLMSTLTAAERTAAAGLKLQTEKLRAALLWLMGFSGAFVFIEPSPYEFVGMAAIAFVMLTGLALRAALAPLVLLLLILNVGYATSLLQVIDQSKLVIWVMVSTFLGVTAIFYGAVLGTNTRARLSWLMRGCLAAGVIASLVAIAAYF